MFANICWLCAYGITFTLKNFIPVKKHCYLVFSLIGYLCTLFTGEQPQVLPTTLRFDIPFELFIW